MKLSEKVAYLKGLGDGLKLDSDKAETKLIHSIIDILEDVAESIDQNGADLAEINARVDEIDLDLGDLESILFEGFEVEELTEEDLVAWGDDAEDTEDVEVAEDADTEEDTDAEENADAEEDAFADVKTVDDLFVAPVVVETEAPVEEVVEEPAEVVEEVVEETAEETVEEVVEEVVEEPALDLETPLVEEEDDASIFADADEVLATAEEDVLEAAEEVDEAVDAKVDEVLEEAEEEAYEVECPTCHKVFYIDETVLAEGHVHCPDCNERLEFEIEYED